MKKILVSIIIILFLGRTFPQKMNVHTQSGINQYDLSDIDSITFVLPGNPNEGLIAYYPFNGNANDESGNGNNGTVNGATLVEDRFSKANCAYSFDGVNDYIEVAHSSSFAFLSNLQTISFWLKMSSFPSGAGDIQRILGKGNVDNWNGFEIYMDYQLGNTYINYNYNNETTVKEFSFQINPSLISVFFHVCFVKESDSVKFYLDGLLVDSNPSSGVIGMDTELFIIGIEPMNLSQDPFNGTMDDIRIYDRALEASEVLSLYSEN